MKKLIILIAVLFTVSAQAKIEIKHWQVGSEWTSKADQKLLTHDHPFESSRVDLTIGGGRVDSLYLMANVDRTRSMYINFKMDSDYFDDVKEAVLSKYDLSCSTKIVRNAMGAEFKNEVCTHEENGDILILTKYDGKISETGLQIYNKQDLDEWNSKQEQKTKSDI